MYRRVYGAHSVEGEFVGNSETTGTNDDILPIVTIIIPNRNGLEHINACLSSLRVLDYPRERLRIIVVDNASTDDSVSFVEDQFPSVLLIENREDQGYAHACNQGARAATSEYVAFLGAETRVDSQWLRQLVAPILSARAEGDTALVCASAQMLTWEGDRIHYTDRRINLFGYPVQTDHGRSSALMVEDAEAQPAPFPSEHGMLIDRKVFLDLDGFDEDLSESFLGIDIGYRLWIFGMRVCRVPKALTYHRAESAADAAEAARSVYLSARDSLALCYKNFEDGHVLSALLGNLLLMGPRATSALTAVGADFEGLVEKNPPSVAVPLESIAWLFAARDFVAKLPTMREKRDGIQRRRILRDDEIPLQRGSALQLQAPAALLRDYYEVIQSFVAPERYAGTRRRIAILCGDVLPLPGVPTSGAGMRIWGLGKGLESRGHEIIWMVHRDILKRMEQIAKAPIPPSWRETAWISPDSIAEIFERVQPELVVAGGWATALSLPKVMQVPLVIDQAGPHLLERFFQRPKTAETDMAEKLEALRNADFFVSSGDVQQTYFEGWLALAGFPRDEHGAIAERMTGIIPFSLAPTLPEHPAANGDRLLTFVYGGYFLPWQDPSRALRTVAAWTDAHGATLRIYGGQPPFHTIDPGVMGELSRELAGVASVEFRGVLPFDELVEQYASADVAIDLMQRNRERELALTTRTVVYLWAGLPVIYNNYSELSDLIAEYDAGWALDPEDDRGLRAVLDEIAKNPEVVRCKSANAQRLVRERFTWDKTIEPLDAFCRMPSVREKIRDAGPAGAGQSSLPPPVIYSSSLPDMQVTAHELNELVQRRRRSSARVMAAGRQIAKTVLRTDKIVAYHDTLAKVGPPLVGNKPITQSFIALEPTITAIDVRFATFCRTNTPMVTATVTVEGSATERTASAPASIFVDGETVRFELNSPVRRAQGKRVLLTLSSPNGILGDSVAPWLRVSPATTSEPARRGRRLLPYPLDFRPVYATSGTPPTTSA